MTNSRKENSTDNAMSEPEESKKLKELKNTVMSAQGVAGHIISLASLGGAHAARVSQFFKTESQAELTQAIERFARLSTEDLCKTGEASEADAMIILKTPALVNKLGRDNPMALFSIGERTINIPEHAYAIHSGEYIYRIGKAHMNAARYIQANLMDRLTSSLREKINDKINPPQRQYYFGGSCTI